MTPWTEEQREAINALHAAPNNDTLWNAVVAFQNYPFFTASGLPFTYQLKVGRRGGLNRELVIDRRENSKTLTWSSLTLAFANAMSQRTDPAVPQLFPRPKAIGDIRSISYIYSIFWRFGLIYVPEKYQEQLERGNMDCIQESIDLPTASC